MTHEEIEIVIGVPGEAAPVGVITNKPPKPQPLTPIRVTKGEFPGVRPPKCDHLSGPVELEFVADRTGVWVEYWCPRCNSLVRIMHEPRRMSARLETK
jgi:hypothetical protein